MTNKLTVESVRAAIAQASAPKSKSADPTWDTWTKDRVNAAKALANDLPGYVVPMFAPMANEKRQIAAAVATNDDEYIGALLQLADPAVDGVIVNVKYRNRAIKDDGETRNASKREMMAYAGIVRASYIMRTDNVTLWEADHVLPDIGSLFAMSVGKNAMLFVRDTRN